jgi:hypothetical protein
MYTLVWATATSSAGAQSIECMCSMHFSASTPTALNSGRTASTACVCSRTETLIEHRKNIAGLHFGWPALCREVLQLNAQLSRVVDKPKSSTLGRSIYEATALSALRRAICYITTARFRKMLLLHLALHQYIIRSDDVLVQACTFVMQGKQAVCTTDLDVFQCVAHHICCGWGQLRYLSEQCAMHLMQLRAHCDVALLQGSSVPGYIPCLRSCTCCAAEATRAQEMNHNR